MKSPEPPISPPMVECEFCGKYLTGDELCNCPTVLSQYWQEKAGEMTPHEMYLLLRDHSPTAADEVMGEIIYDAPELLDSYKMMLRDMLIREGVIGAPDDD